MRPDANMTLPPIKDIKPMVEIPDLSPWLYWGVIILGVLVLALAIFFLVLKILSLREENRAKRYLEALHRVEWSDPKKAAYTITHYGRLLATDDRRKELFNQLLPLLERYKYRREVGPVDEETKRRFELYRQVCDESV
jgi:flagellar biosynthesis/type III secretory pathway M-ring protein FliF/YscJ